MHGAMSEATRETIWREELVGKEDWKRMVPSNLTSTTLVARRPSRMKLASSDNQRIGIC